MTAAVITLESPAVPAKRESMLRLFAEQFFASKLAVLGLILLVLFLCLSISPVAPRSPRKSSCDWRVRTLNPSG